MENIPQQDRIKWLSRLDKAEPSQVLREIADAYDVGRPELGMMLGDLFQGVTTQDVQIIWHWDITKNGRGISDDRLNEAISRLTVKR